MPDPLIIQAFTIINVWKKAVYFAYSPLSLKCTFWKIIKDACEFQNFRNTSLYNHTHTHTHTHTQGRSKIYTDIMRLL